MSDSRVQLSVNLYGAQAMSLSQMVEYRQKTNIRASIAVAIPTGQYDPARLVNIGTNRIAYKPEIAISQAFRKKWIAEGYAGVWFYGGRPAAAIP